jgi:hypothetical protein
MKPTFELRLALLTLACLLAQPALAANDDERPEWSFVPGRYTLIGRHPDSQATYTGTAKIERVGKQLRLTRTIAGKRSTIYGSARTSTTMRASPATGARRAIRTPSRAWKPTSPRSRGIPSSPDNEWRYSPPSLRVKRSVVPLPGSDSAQTLPPWP